MPSTTVYNMAGEAVEKLELSAQVFGVTPNMAVLWIGCLRSQLRSFAPSCWR